MDPLTQFKRDLAAKFRLKASKIRDLIRNDTCDDNRTMLFVRASELEWAAEAVEKPLDKTVPIVTTVES